MKINDIKWLPAFIILLILAGLATDMEWPFYDVAQDLCIGYLMASMIGIVLSHVDPSLYDSVNRSFLSRTAMTVGCWATVYCINNSIDMSPWSLAGRLMG